MKLFISVDMEGMAGITNNVQESDDRVLFRNALHTQLEWIFEGIRTSSRDTELTEITVADSHGEGTNLLFERISAMDRRASLVSGSPRRQFMTAGLDDTYDLAFFAGYHAGAGHTPACMDHSYYGKVVSELRINGRVMNEATANAARAGELGVPLALAIGDSGLYDQLIGNRWMPWVEVVVTKYALSCRAVKYRPWEDIKQETITKVRRVLDKESGTIPLYRLDTPCTLSITFHRSLMADMAAHIPGSIRDDARTVSVRCKDMEETLCGISACTALAATVA
ncbi:MAG: M55 family metallopeptidase [Spirochaetaceae bacterium]|jgi:D-amino peptidase|nr:M55 family metallopeptidase [Spirochaetaceae bacterium]